MKLATRAAGLAGAAFLLAVGQWGCAVTQEPGRGKQMRLVEPNTQTSYHLYLPEDYTAHDGRRPDGQRWPLVVTLHGLRPYDNAAWQNKEWQEEADRYGFVVVAPDLRTCDSLTMQLPLQDPTLWYVQRDEKGILAVMDEVFRRTNADPQRVLVTSFSSGGYLAHYMLNRHPDRFTCLAVRGSNFSEAMLNLQQIARYRDTPIGIFFGENDIKICHEESVRAVEWYRRNRFPVEARVVNGLGHERRPQLAAALFARTAGLTPKSPPDLGQLVIMDVPTRDGSIARTPIERPPVPVYNSSSLSPTAVSASSPRLAQRDILFNPPARPVSAAGPGSPGRAAIAPPARVSPAPPGQRPVNPVPPPPAVGATPKRPILQPYTTTPEPPPRLERRPELPPVPLREQAALEPAPATIEVHGDTIGPAPMWINLSLRLHPRLHQGASVMWTSNDVPIGANGFEVQTVLREPGDYTIAACILTADDRRLVARTPIKVLPPASRPAGS